MTTAVKKCADIRIADEAKAAEADTRKAEEAALKLWRERKEFYEEAVWNAWRLAVMRREKLMELERLSEEEGSKVRPPTNQEILENDQQLAAARAWVTEVFAWYGIVPATVPR
jgi:hypothetical protein